MRKIYAVLIFMFTTFLLVGQEAGINVSDPEYTLDLRSISISEAAQLNVSNSDKSKYIRFFSGNDMFPDPVLSLSPGRNLLFASFDDLTFAFNEYMRISPSGDVGIGVINPEAKLDLLGGDGNLDAGNAGDLRIGNANHNFRVGVATSGSGAGTSKIYTNSNDLILGTDNSPVMTIAKEGNIGVGTQNPNSSAILQLTSTNQGVLIPRLTAFQISEISNPDFSLLVYQTDVSPGFYYNSGTSISPIWKKIGDDPPTQGRFSRNYAPENKDFTVPVGVTRIYFEIVGGGGGVGATYLVNNGANRGGGGGGGGGFASGYFDVTPGEVLSLTIGARGNSGTSGMPGNNGSDGGTSSISRGGTTLISVSGGKRGNSATLSQSGSGGAGGGISTINTTIVKLTCTNWSAVAGSSGVTTDAVDLLNISGVAGCVNNSGKFNRLHIFESSVFIGGSPTAIAASRRTLPYYGVGGGRNHGAQGGYIVLNW